MVTDQPDPRERFDSIQDVESILNVERLLLDAASAIQRLKSERDELQRRVDSLESEAASLRERTTLIQDSYRRLANEFVTQLQLLDSSARNLQDPRPPVQGEEAAPGGSS